MNYEITRSNRKTIALKVTPDGILEVAAPNEATNDDIAFLTKAYTNQSSELVTVFPVGMKGKAIKVGDTVNDGWCSIVKWDTETASFSFGRGMSKDAIGIGNIYENPELLK